MTSVANPESIASISTVISNLNSLYDNLIVYTGILIALVGVFVPVIISLVQRRQFSNQQRSIEEALKVHLENQIDLSKKSLENYLEIKHAKELESVDSRMKTITEEVERKFGFLEGGLFMIQAKVFVANNQYLYALNSIKNAVIDNVRWDARANITPTIGDFKSILRGANMVNVQDRESFFNTADESVKFLENNNGDNRFATEIQNLKEEIRSAKARIDNPI